MILSSTIVTPAGSRFMHLSVRERKTRGSNHFTPSPILIFKSQKQQTSSSFRFRRFSGDHRDSLPTLPTLTLDDDDLTVIVLPLPKTPLMPGFFMTIYVKDPKLLSAIKKNISRGVHYAGAFLSDASDSSSDETENVLGRIKVRGRILKGNNLLKHIYEFGTLAQISGIEGEKVFLVGHRRVQLTEMVSEDPLTVKVNHLKDKPYNKDDAGMKATYSELTSTLMNVLNTSSSWRSRINTYIQQSDFDYPHLADFGAGISGATKHQIQEVLEVLDVHKRLKLTLALAKSQVETNTEEESPVPFVKIRGRIERNKDRIPQHVLNIMEEECSKLKDGETNKYSFNQIYTYLDWITSLPWGKLSAENFDVQRAKEILDREHFGLSDVKERIQEFIAVGRLRGTAKGKILCFSGPPGVGKTSIGRSIARALNRKFFRFSVGGLSDVSEIKGHSQTYVGARPGKLVQCLKELGTENPLILIDEIDKLGSSHKGDPASALLELMDPEQNANFLDHYLSFTLDLSKVLFVCTANEIEKISEPLLDRMEVIDLAGYVTEEKMHIAKQYLLKTTCRDCGIKPDQVDISDAALFSLIENYCREAGVRNLQKQIEKIYRKVALYLVSQGAVPGTTDDTVDTVKTDSTFKTMNLVDIMRILQGASKQMTAAVTVEKVMIDESNLADYVGRPVLLTEKYYEQTPVGVVMGLAWSSMGGSTLYIETAVVEEGEGKGSLNITGQLGDVMKESAHLAHTVARKIMLEKVPENQFFANSKLHLHVPAGATPKDGPSAGCTMITSLLSLAMKKPVRKDLAMTGEVTLTGRILAIGGVKEKTMAARRSQVKMLIFPEANRADYGELPENVKEGIEVHFVDEYEQIFKLAFGYDDLSRF